VDKTVNVVGAKSSWKGHCRAKIRRFGGRKDGGPRKKDKTFPLQIDLGVGGGGLYEK